MLFIHLSLECDEISGNFTKGIHRKYLGHGITVKTFLFVIKTQGEIIDLLQNQQSIFVNLHFSRPPERC